MKRKNILVTGTTYPRWENDSVPPFLQIFCQNIAPLYSKVDVLVPHAAGAKTKERDGNLHLKRFRYMFPARFENIVYGGGGVFKIKKTPWYIFRLLCFSVSYFFNLLGMAIFRKPDLINVHWIIPQGLFGVVVKFLTGKKLVISVHGADIMALNGRFMVKIKRFILRHTDHVVANSSASKKACQEIYPEVAISIIPMGTDMEHFSPGDKPREVVQKYNLDGKFTLLFVGRLTKVKGTIYLLEALTLLKKANVPFRAVIVGEGPERATLEQYVKAHNLAQEVIFAGWVQKSELVKVYRAADVFVGPSLHEALGLVFVEAQATGLPVVASDVDGIPDVVQDGKTGFLVERKSPQALHDAIYRLYNDPKLRQRMRQNAPHIMHEAFSWPAVVERYQKVFADLM